MTITFQNLKSNISQNSNLSSSLPEHTFHAFQVLGKTALPTLQDRILWLVSTIPFSELASDDAKDVIDIKLCVEIHKDIGWVLLLWRSILVCSSDLI